MLGTLYEQHVSVRPDHEYIEANETPPPGLREPSIVFAERRACETCGRAPDSGNLTHTHMNDALKDAQKISRTVLVFREEVLGAVIKEILGRRLMLVRCSA